MAYVSAVSRDKFFSGKKQESVALFKNSQGDILGHQYYFDVEKNKSIFLTGLPSKNAAIAWGDNLMLTGYEFTPLTIEPGGISNLNLTWKLLGYSGLIGSDRF